MKAHKVTLTIIDFDDIGADEIQSVIESVHYPNHCISPSVWNIETADIGDWDDDHILNDNRTAADEWRRLFPSLAEPVEEEQHVTKCSKCGMCHSEYTPC